MSEFKLRADCGGWPRFGDYAVVEQKRHGVPNEMYYHKVVATLESNAWVDVPVQYPATEYLHGHSERIAIVICCGVDESKTYRVRVADLHKVEVSGCPGEAMSGWIKCSDRLPEPGTLVIASGFEFESFGGGRWVEPSIFDEECFHALMDDGAGVYVADFDGEMNETTHWQHLPSPPTE